MPLAMQNERQKTRNGRANVRCASSTHESPAIYPLTRTKSTAVLHREAAVTQQKDRLAYMRRSDADGAWYALIPFTGHRKSDLRRLVTRRVRALCHRSR